MSENSPILMLESLTFSLIMLKHGVPLKIKYITLYQFFFLLAT